MGWDRRLPATDGPVEPRPPPPDLDEIEWPDWPEPAGEDEGPARLSAAFGDLITDLTCPRCGAELDRYALGERESLLCNDCGYAGVAVAHVGKDAWRKAVDRLVRGQLTSRRG